MSVALRTESTVPVMMGRMTDLEGAVPPHEPAEDALAFAARGALSLIPLFGSIAADTLSHALESRHAARQRDFNVLIAQAVTGAVERLDDAISIEDVLDSDEFIAAYQRASRAASETASAGKRRRLAEAIARAVVPSNFKTSEIDAYTRLVEQYDDLRVWLIAFYCDPAAWLNANGKSYAADPGIRGGRMDEPLRDALDADAIRTPAVRDAIEDLQRDNVLGTFVLETQRSDRGQFAGQTTRRGRRLLDFIRQGDPASAPVPEVL